MSQSSYVVQVDCTEDDNDDIDHSELVAAWYYSRQPPLRISALEPWVKNKKRREDHQNNFCQHINEIHLGDLSQ